MKSIKPGRGPSGMSAIGSIIAVIFGIFWTISAASMGAPGFFPLFGILFVIMGIVQAIYHFNNATGKNRFSSFDITEEGEENDPLNGKFGASTHTTTQNQSNSSRYCPYCGSPVATDFSFCEKCGKELPH